jgi:hypothetical protein
LWHSFINVQSVGKTKDIASEAVAIKWNGVVKFINNTNKPGVVSRGTEPNNDSGLSLEWHFTKDRLPPKNRKVFVSWADSATDADSEPRRLGIFNRHQGFDWKVQNEGNCGWWGCPTPKLWAYNPDITQKALLEMGWHGPYNNTVSEWYEKPINSFGDCIRVILDEDNKSLKYVVLRVSRYERNIAIPIKYMDELNTLANLMTKK